MAGFPCISIPMQAGRPALACVGFWPIEGNGLKMVRRNDKARSERALSERFERDSKRLSIWRIRRDSNPRPLLRRPMRYRNLGWRQAFKNASKCRTARVSSLTASCSLRRIATSEGSYSWHKKRNPEYRFLTTSQTLARPNVVSLSLSSARDMQRASWLSGG